MWGDIAAIAVAVVLLVAGVSKIAAPESWRAQAAGLGVANVVAAPVPLVELALAALLLAGWQRAAVAWVAAALVVVFTALLVVRLAQGRRPPCACFGSLSPSPIGPWHLVRNGVLVGLAVAAAML